jgi:hypothetical protein
MLKQLGAAMLLCLLAISPVSAQNAAPLEAGTNTTADSVSFHTPKLDKDLERTRMDIEKDIEKTKQDNDKDIQKTKLDNEKAIQETKLDDEKAMAQSHADMVRALAWNSWVLFATAFVFVAYVAGNIKDKRRHETIRLMVEKGTPITPELIEAMRKKNRGSGTHDPKGYLCWGITETLVAIALLICFPAGGGHIAGWIVLAVGVANLILWLIDRAHSNSGQTK